jgi:hypothetical protein
MPLSASQHPPWDKCVGAIAPRELDTRPTRSRCPLISRPASRFIFSSHRDIFVLPPARRLINASAQPSGCVTRCLLILRDVDK